MSTWRQNNKIMNENNNSNETPQCDSYNDKCVVCDCVTHEPKQRHIDYRNFYIEGVGQLCNECFTKTYNYGRNKY